MKNLMINTDLFNQEVETTTDSNNAAAEALAALSGITEQPVAIAASVVIKAKYTLLKGDIAKHVKSLVGQKVDVSKVPAFQPGGQYVFPDCNYVPQVIPDNSFLADAYHSGRYTYLIFKSMGV